jgi:diketogulonate reductase-like aldo/keto reductase
MTVAQDRDVQGVSVPTFLYGTAWKEYATTSLVAHALVAGFRGIDTANQRRHYHEEGVGQALAWAFEAGVPRDELFLQSKFTHAAGQDHRLPYDPHAPVAAQVEQSFRNSLENLGVERLDSLVLHGPTQRHGLGAADREAWRALEAIHDAGGARLIGVSNVLPEQIERLLELARVPPAFVQNRCFAHLGWDAAVRAVCQRHGIVYQAFSLLTANAHVRQHHAVRAIAARHGRTVPQVIFRFALERGMIPLTGTTDRAHMDQALDAYAFELDDDEVQQVQRAGGGAQREGE